MGIDEDDVFNPDGYRRWRAFGPFIDPDTFDTMPTTYRAIIIGSVIFGLSMTFAILAACLAVQQTRNSRRPWKSVYVWMIWIELVACIVIALECLLFLLYHIQPSFYFFMSILLLWSIQIHLLLQIIVNRIRIIMHDRAKGRAMIIGVALVILCINISVFCIWIPARLQISEWYIHINNIWDRCEKVLYLLIDACLNWYFIRIVKQNLVVNGLQKYNRLVRFNQRIILVSLLMDVMIIGAMSIPNGFIYVLFFLASDAPLTSNSYAMFHPLAFLVKLNIEMLMANLIRHIALENQNQNAFLLTFASRSSDFAPDTPATTQRHRRWLSSLMESKREVNPILLQEDGIVKTEEFSVVSRRRSQMSGHLFKRGSQKSVRREDSLALDETSLESGESSTHEEEREKVGVGDGEEVVLIAAPAATRKP